MFTSILSFVVSFFALTAIDFTKLVSQKKVNYAQLLLILLSMALAYLVTQFIFGLTL
jgi:uncharacterized integral membrane protein (TIGR02327 family)